MHGTRADADSTRTITVNRRFVVRRLLQLVPTVIGILLIGFALVHLAPGDPILALAGENGDAAYYAFMRHRFGLDLPLPQQFVVYVTRVASGDLGASFVTGRGVMAVIVERIPATLLLTGTALVLTVVVAIPLGIVAAWRAGSAYDIGIGAAGLVIFSAPPFWIGQLAILVFALHLGIVPVQGMTDAGELTAGFAYARDLAAHLALPALVLASHEIVVLMRVTRAGLARELALHHVRTARAKGVSELMVVFRHALPRALLPVIAVIGARVGQLLAGAVVVEVVFGWPGMGRLLLAGLEARDIPVLLGLFIVLSIVIVLMNLLTDFVYAARDDRIRFR